MALPARTDTGGQTHMIPGSYGLCGFPRLSFDLSPLPASGRPPVWRDFNPAITFRLLRSSSTYQKDNGRGPLDSWFFILKVQQPQLICEHTPVLHQSVSIAFD